MKTRLGFFLLFVFVVTLLCVVMESPRTTIAQSDEYGGQKGGPDFDNPIQKNARQLVEQGERIFRFDTFGDEAFWGDTLKLHQAIEGAKLGGVGPGVSPATALAVGLKVDAKALPASLVAALKEGKVNLSDPATTLSLLKLNAVVGVTGFFDAQGTLRSVGIQCAFCHSTVDNSLASGIGNRLDGWANRLERRGHRSVGSQPEAPSRPVGSGSGKGAKSLEQLGSWAL